VPYQAATKSATNPQSQRVSSKFPHWIAQAMTFTATNTNYREGGKETIPPEQAGVSYLQGESAPPPVRTDPHSTPTRPTSAEGAEGRGGRGADAGWGGSWAALAENDDGVTVCLMRGEGGPKPKLNPRGFVCFVPIFRASESEVEDDGSSYIAAQMGPPNGLARSTAFWPGRLVLKPVAGYAWD
jgi:hypothetical protein